MQDPRGERTLARVLAKRVARHGDKPWVVTEHGSHSYREVDRRSNQLARGLAGFGVRAGETVLVMLPDGIEIIQVWCALAKLGAIEVPVNTHLRGNVLRHLLNDSAASVMIIHERFFERLESLAEELSALKHLIVLGDNDLPAALGERLGSSRFTARFDGDEGPLEGGPRYRDLVAVMYTSGTTGPSKGVMITHAHAYEYALAVVEALELGEGDVYYSPLPLFHIAGQWAAVYASCIAGATVVVPGAFSLGRFWDDVRRHRATCSFLLGAMANWIHGQSPAASDADNPMERLLIVPLFPEVEVFKARFGVRVSTTWGSTEINCPTRSGFDLADNKTCGRVAADRFEIRIVDRDGEEQPPGVPGEALVRARHPWTLMAGYWNNPRATVEAWSNQWVRSGDLLMKDEAGNLTFVDRAKDAIRRRGENISSLEVEVEVNAHPAVLECAVIPVDYEHGEQEVMAVVVLKDGLDLAPADLIAFLQPRMAHFMVPRYLDLVEALPKTQTGKIQKFGLRDRGVTATTWDREAAGIEIKRA